MAGKTVAVTGARGYLGHALVSELHERGENIRLSLRHDCRDFDSYGCEKIIGDIGDIDHLCEAFKGAETVYHVAGLVDITGKMDDLVWQVNYEGTKNVVSACKQCGVKNLVYVSSVDCIKVTDDMRIIREPADFNPDDFEDAYGKSKAAATKYVLESGDENLKCCSVHPSCCIGPDDYYHKNSVCAMITLYDEGFFPVTLSFGAYNFVDVRDVAKGMIATAEKGRNGECYILCGETLTVDGFIRTLAKINDRKPPKIALGKKTILRIMPAVAAFLKAKNMPPVLTPFSINKICENCNFSYEKAANELGYKPMSAEQSLTDTVRWLKENPAE